MNGLGSDAAAASVAVEGPPDAPSGKPSISQGPDRIAVAWCGPPYDGGCMITGFMCVQTANYNTTLITLYTNTHIHTYIDVCIC